MTSSGVNEMINLSDYQTSGGHGAPTSNWNVSDITLRPIPQLHPPLDPCCTVLIGDAAPSVVAARVSDCLRNRSIVAQFDDETATARAVTSERTHFVIRLYSVAPSSVLVECTRTRGCPMTFHRNRRAILSSAAGSYSEDLPSPPSPTIGEEKGDAAEVGLEIAWGLLKKDRTDANVLGMESLVFLTDMNSSGNSAEVASAVILGSEDVEEEDERHSEIRDRILDLLKRQNDGSNIGQDEHKSSHDSDSDDDDNDRGSGAVTCDDREHLSTLRSLALRVFSNSLEALPLQTLPLWQEDLLPSLEADIRRSEENPHDAVLAIRIVRQMVERMNDGSVEERVADCLIKARDVGRRLNRNLELECELCLSAVLGRIASARGGVARAKQF